eukprot:scaffold182568_cov24-Tisochrysis_lutea.AAC.1
MLIRNDLQCSMKEQQGPGARWCLASMVSWAVKAMHAALDACIAREQHGLATGKHKVLRHMEICHCVLGADVPYACEPCADVPLSASRKCAICT